ncbi:Outer membrane lipoprotein [Fructilactobacillus fructivorans]|nr:Outer membrane lipoprotein [Fructilactobacillus fructivorans]
MDIMKRSTKWIIGIVIVVVIVGLGWFSFAHHSEQSKKTVKVGLMSGSKVDDKIWESVAETAKKKYGVTIQFTHFTDYTQPNKALTQHEIDLNSFQHYAFLDNWNKQNHTNIVSVGNTYIAPIRLYSNKYKNVKDIPNGGTIALPNDTSNESRSLYLLKNAGLITLKDKKCFLGLNDIEKNPKNLKFKEVDASQTPRVLNSVDGSIVNNTYAAPAHLSEKQSIYVEPLNKDSKIWVNLIAANKDQKNNKNYQDVVKAFQTKKTEQLVKKYYGNTEIPAWNRKF